MLFGSKKSSHVTAEFNINHNSGFVHNAGLFSHYIPFKRDISLPYLIHLENGTHSLHDSTQASLAVSRLLLHKTCLQHGQLLYYLPS